MFGIILILTLVASIFIYTGIKVFTWMFPSWKDWIIFDDKTYSMYSSMDPKPSEMSAKYRYEMTQKCDDEVIFPL